MSETSKYKEQRNRFEERIKMASLLGSQLRQTDPNSLECHLIQWFWMSLIRQIL
jgi:hypothetical protein